MAVHCCEEDLAKSTHHAPRGAAASQPPVTAPRDGRLQLRDLRAHGPASPHHVAALLAEQGVQLATGSHGHAHPA